MKSKLLIALAVVAMVGVASADILVPNGDFELGSTDWAEVNGGGAGATYSYPATGGNGGGYGQIDSTAGNWAIWVAANDTAIPLAYFGLSAGDTITLTLDMKEFSNDGGNTAGMKIESWDAGFLDNGAGDVKFALTSDWQTYTFDYTINAAATGLKFVPVQHDGISVGYDNIGVIPEPATLGLFGLAGGAMVFLRRLGRF